MMSDSLFVTYCAEGDNVLAMVVLYLFCKLKCADETFVIGPVSGWEEYL